MKPSKSSLPSRARDPAAKLSRRDGSAVLALDLGSFTNWALRGANGHEEHRMNKDTYYKSNGKGYCIRKSDDGSCKAWNANNRVIGEVKTLADAFELIKAD